VHINRGAISCKKFGELLPGNSRDNRTNLRTYVTALSENRPTHLHSSCCHSEKSSNADWNADGRINSGDNQATPGINLVGFWLVILSLCDATVHSRRQSALELVYVCLLGSSTVKFRYYSLGGNNATPSGLYARLCDAFLVITAMAGGLHAELCHALLDNSTLKSFFLFLAAWSSEN